VTKDWRCKCGMVNKAGTFMCVKRGCKIYFCQGCGLLGHQQRFCRQGGSSGAANGAGSSAVEPSSSAAPAKPDHAASASSGGTTSRRRGANGHKEAAAAAAADLLDDTNGECVVCMDATAQITLYPCGHNITCASCTRALILHGKPCPFCAVDIAYTDLGKQPGRWNIA